MVNDESLDHLSARHFLHKQTMIATVPSSFPSAQRFKELPDKIRNLYRASTFIFRFESHLLRRSTIRFPRRPVFAFAPYVDGIVGKSKSPSCPLQVAHLGDVDFRRSPAASRVVVQLPRAKIAVERDARGPVPIGGYGASGQVWHFWSRPAVISAPFHDGRR